jgi:hypothetical protein
MANTRFLRALSDVTSVFRRPEEILDADDFSRSEKIALLRQWETDLRLLMIASEENMQDGVPGETAELMLAVRQSLRRIGAPAGEDAQPAPDKAGGG